MSAATRQLVDADAATDLRQAIIDSRKTRSEVARGSGLSPSMISHIMSGTRPPSRKASIKIRNFLSGKTPPALHRTFPVTLAAGHPTDNQTLVDHRIIRGLRERLLATGKGYQEISAETGLSYQYIALFSRGTVAVSWKAADVLAEYLGLRIVLLDLERT